MDDSATETKAAFARRIGVKPPRVSQLVSSGLPLDGDGKVRIAAALAWLEGRQNPVKRAEQGKMPLPSGHDDDVPIQNPALALLAAKARREATLADRDALFLERERGALIARDAVQRGLTAWGLGQRDALLAWCSRAAPELAADLGVDLGRVFAALDRQVRAQLIELADAPPPPDLKDLFDAR
ncbi:hypothetical protein D3877_17440 [Azospirillum cavernae]|uniref:Terminase small subunit n=1 Tax=Azospirillum cavernae TaxID=2320860 RepID=A0A418VXH9_9PROT|nr:hypothetical protein [Azospirillum cavernae]RJF81881.1 hypothetical protein D3877_17440 [Azospirillum cavernae]